jgi:uncharacterized protein
VTAPATGPSAGPSAGPTGAPSAGPSGAPSATDAAVVAAQLGREPRALLAVAHRCPCGLPDVVETAPRLLDGTPFPTLYYLTCPRAVAAVSRLEAGGLMREMNQRIAADPRLREEYRAAHRSYLARRDEVARASGVEPLPPGTPSAGGMPDRVKCLHALVAHHLAATGDNPLGAEAARAAGEWWLTGPCIAPPVDFRPADPPPADAPPVDFRLADPPPADAPPADPPAAAR